MIDKLTPEQEALLPVYREKWRAISHSTEPIDREKAADAVKAIYPALGQQQPKIIFFDSPYAARKSLSLLGRLRACPFDTIGDAIIKINSISKMHLETELFHKVFNYFSSEFPLQLFHQIRSQIDDENIPQPKTYGATITIPQNLYWAPTIDYFLSGLSIYCQESQYKGELYLSLAANCGEIYSFEEICYLCDRPRILSFDSQQRLHAEGSPAIQFADDFSVYAYHGVRLPEKYGKVHPQHWRSEWLLSEDNAELRRVLIQAEMAR